MKSNPTTRCIGSLLYCLWCILAPAKIFCQEQPPLYRDSSTTVTTITAANSLPCGTDMLLAQQRKDPVFVAKEKAMNAAILQHALLARSSRTMAADYTLPVVFHIINANPSTITDIAVLNALQSMNEAFSITGAFAGGRTDTRIQFCLAKTDPSGGKTSGILRTKTYLGDYDYDMEAGNMTALGRWDPSRYVNIWVVEDIKSEYMQTFECGVWTRLKMGGYASAGGDIVVAGLGIGVLCHETGHYLSLQHTFAARDCANADCSTSGDMVCDTPPEKSITGGFPCASPSNSCSTDTLSGFTMDVPDLPDNFMDYGNGIGCILSFTEGQADRMRNFIATSLTGMISSTACTDPCPDAVTAAFTPSINYPVVGDLLHFTNTSTSANSYQWLVDGVAAATTADFDFTVTQKKNYTITLRAYGTTPGCFSSTDFIAQTSCGVTARFWPDKRLIASKQNIQLDSVFFTNRSIGATSYQWLMSNNAGMAEQVVATSFHLNYVFLDPAVYKIRLVASNGSCSDTTNVFTLRVDDASPDAGIAISSVECYTQTKARIQFWFYNNGYKTIPKNTPVSFYNRNPSSPNAQLVGSTYLLPYPVTGKCTSFLETYLLNVGYDGLDTLYAVINDNGSTIPLALPNTALVEKLYANNLASRTNFSFHITAAPANVTRLPLQTVTLAPSPLSGGAIISAVWSPPTDLSCTNCQPTVFKAPYRGDTLVQKKVMAYSRFGCHDTALAIIHIPPGDDYSIAITDLECAAGGDSVYASFTICNAWPGSDVPPGLKVSFYDADAAAGNAALLGSVFVNPVASADSCVSFRQLIKQSSTGTVYAVVNDNGMSIPVAFPGTAGILEKNYANNTGSKLYTAPPLAVTPADTTVFRNDPITLSYSTPMIGATNPIWQAATGFTISCTHCASPLVTAQDSSVIHMQVTNRYGCTVQASGKVHIFPPDMTVEVLDTKCITNDSTLVSFRVCMNNRYNSVFGGIPVSFYDGANGQPLLPVFYTSAAADSCKVYTHLIATPHSTTITAAVNDKDSGTTIYKETDYANNKKTQPFIPFSVSFAPSVIELLRPGTTVLHPQVIGGIPAAYKWVWAETLSCYDCAAPVANTVSTTHYQVKVNNEYRCTDTAVVTIKTFTHNTINIPNGFTPDANGQNDVFYVIGSNSIKQIKDFSIFNRWGQKVFAVNNVPANDKQYGWKGNVGGHAAAPGGYVYNIVIELENGTTESYKGVVMLIR